MKLSNKHIVHCGRCNPGCLEWLLTDNQLQDTIAPFAFFRFANIDPEVTVKFILWNEYGCMPDGQHGEAALLEYCAKHRPYMVVINAQGVPIMFDDGETAYELRRMGIKTVFQWGDSVEHTLRQRILQIAPESDLCIYLDDPLFEQQMPDKLLWMWSFPPIVPAPAPPHKDIDVSFAGSLVRYPDRLRYLTYLNNQGVNVVVCGGDTGVPPIGDIFHRSKISLNFSLVNQGTQHQLKSRTVEAPAAYSLLLESANPLTPMMYEPYKEFVPFFNEEDLAEKIRYYLFHDDERNDIVMRAHKRLFDCYTPTQWWERVFNRLESV